MRLCESVSECVCVRVCVLRTLHSDRFIAMDPRALSLLAEMKIERELEISPKGLLALYH